MSEQGSLEGFEVPATIDNLFFALVPDPAAADRIDGLAQALARQHGLKLRPRATWHVTLYHVGTFAGLPEAIVAQACASATAMRAQPVELSFDRLVSFAGAPGNRPQVLQCSESTALSGFQADLSQRMRKAGLTHGQHQAIFTPHLTLSYGPQSLQAQAIDPITWVAHDFVLIRSIQGEGRHVVLGRWPLGGVA